MAKQNNLDLIRLALRKRGYSRARAGDWDDWEFWLVDPKHKRRITVTIPAPRGKGQAPRRLGELIAISAYGTLRIGSRASFAVPATPMPKQLRASLAAEGAEARASLTAEELGL